MSLCTSMLGRFLRNPLYNVLKMMYCFHNFEMLARVPLFHLKLTKISYLGAMKAVCKVRISRLYLPINFLHCVILYLKKIYF